MNKKSDDCRRFVRGRKADYIGGPKTGNSLWNPTLHVCRVFPGIRRAGTLMTIEPAIRGIPGGLWFTYHVFRSKSRLLKPMLAIGFGRDRAPIAEFRGLVHHFHLKTRHIAETQVRHEYRTHYRLLRLRLGILGLAPCDGFLQHHEHDSMGNRGGVRRRFRILVPERDRVGPLAAVPVLRWKANDNPERACEGS